MKGKNMFKKVLKFTAHVLVAKAAVKAFDQALDFVLKEWERRNKSPEDPK